jgi:hypothetical protein
MQIEYVEWEPLKNKLAGSVFGEWILRRSVDDSRDGFVNGVGESRST